MTAWSRQGVVPCCFLLGRRVPPSLRWKLLIVLVALFFAVQVLYLIAPPPPFGSWEDQIVHLLTILPALLIRNAYSLRGSCLPPLHSNGDPPRPKMAIVMGHTNAAEPYVAPCVRRMMEYSHRHNYTFVKGTELMLDKLETHPEDIRRHWLKLEVIRDVLLLNTTSSRTPNAAPADAATLALNAPATGTTSRLAEPTPLYDWVAWFDGDVWVDNLEVELERFLPSSPTTSGQEEVSMVISRDDEGINSGVWLLRNSKAGLQLLDEWRRYMGRLDFPRDQRALRDIYNRRALWNVEDSEGMVRELMKGTGEGTTIDAPAAGFLVNRQCAMNATPTPTRWDGVFMRGDFAVHFFGFPKRKKEFCVDTVAKGGLLVCF